MFSFEGITSYLGLSTTAEQLDIMGFEVLFIRPFSKHGAQN